VYLPPVTPSQTTIAGQKGLKSEALRAALDQALRGRLDDLQRLLARHGGMPSPTPNFELGAAFGAEIAGQKGDVTKVLNILAATRANAEMADVFLPIAAAYGWVALIHTSPDNPVAWEALHEFLADDRAPVRLGVQDAFLRLCGHPDHSAGLLTQALRWMDEEGHKPQYDVAALIVQIFGNKTILGNLADKALLQEFLSRVLAAIANAPRSAARWDSFRRLLAVLPRSVAVYVASGGSSSQPARAVQAWLKNECVIAQETPVRDVLSEAIVELRAPALGQATNVIDALRAALAGGTKPPRDPTRVRPGQGRGKRSRQIR
jgi:hypothetical protein